MIFKAESTEIICYHQKSVTNIYPAEGHRQVLIMFKKYFSNLIILSGWYEQNPLEIISVVEECIEKACDKLVALGGEVKDIKAVGITNQRESTVVWDPDTGKDKYKLLNIQK